MSSFRVKRLCAACILISVVSAWFCVAKPYLACCSPAMSATLPEVSARASILIEWQTGTILFEKSGFTRMHPASLTKMMTALLAVERGRLEDMIHVSREAASQPGSSMNLRPGDLFSLEDLLHGLMLVSGNDAAWAIAEHIANGATSDFFALMNQRAKQLGAINTRFENPHGLTDPNHYTTAFDLAIIARACLKHPYFKYLAATKEKDVIEAESSIVLSLQNTNRLLWLLPGADGVKTGTTQAAGQCLVASATRDGMRLLAVVLDSLDRWHDTSKLLEYGFSNFRFVKVVPAGDTLVTLPASRSTEKHVPVLCLTDLSACIPKHILGLRIEVDLPSRVVPPCPAGTILGQATLCLGNQVVGYSDLVAGVWVNPKTPLRAVVYLASKVITLFCNLGLL